MRILLATYWYLPHIGGVSTYVYNLRRELQKLGHEVDIFAHYPDMQKYYITNNGRYLEKPKVKDLIYEKVLRYYNQQLPQVDPWIRWREIERYCYEVAVAAFGLSKYNLIHTQDIISTRALWRVKPRNVPLIATIHGCLATEFLISGEIQGKDTLAWSYVRNEERLGATSSDITIVPTQWLKNLYVDQFDVPNDHLQVIPYGMDIDRFLGEIPRHPKLERPVGKKILACPARLVPVKGHQYLLEALAILNQNRNDWVCWLIGNGPLRSKLEQQSKQLNLQDQVLFLGDRDDVPSLLYQSDIFILPSLQDNQPFTVMEAQVSGKPVIVSDAGGIPEMVVHGETGLISPAGNVDSLMANISKVLDDDDYRNRLAHSGKKWAMQEWALPTMMKRTMNVYQKFEV